VLGIIFPDPKEIPVIAVSVDIKSGPENIIKIGEALSQYRN